MKPSDFEVKCKPYSMQYKHIFGYTPCYGDYECTQEEFILALNRSLVKRRKIYNFLNVKKEPNYRAFLPVGDNYESRMNEVLMKIYRKNYTNDTYTYAYKILKLYLERQKEITEEVSNAIEFYGVRFTPEEIRERLGRPQIEILGDGSGIITWPDHKIDDYIIEYEFVNDLFLLGISINK